VDSYVRRSQDTSDAHARAVFVESTCAVSSIGVCMRVTPLFILCCYMIVEYCSAVTDRSCGEVQLPLTLDCIWRWNRHTESRKDVPDEYLRTRF